MIFGPLGRGEVAGGGLRYGMRVELSGFDSGEENFTDIEWSGVRLYKVK